MDRGHERTEQVISKIEGRLRAEYEQAAKEVEETLKDYMERFALKDKKWQEWVKDGKRTQEQYDAWRKQQLMQGERWKQLKNQLAEDMVNTTSAARDIVQSYMPEVYEINANYALYQVEVGGGYTLPSSLTLYNREAIARLVKDEPDLMPMGKSVLGDIARGKAQRWERQKVQSIMMQGILQGKSNVRIAQDIAENLANGDFKASMRYARTMSTNAQNGGRYGAYRRLEENGVPLTLQWEATLDMRTRHEHRMMHGQRRNVNQPFEVDGVEILYPAWLGMGDYKVPPDMIWNCRCTILAFVKGFEHDALKTSERMEGLSYEDWLNAKERPDPITKQRDIGEMMRMRYIREYGGDGSGLKRGKNAVESHEEKQVEKTFAERVHGIIEKANKFENGITTDTIRQVGKEFAKEVNGEIQRQKQELERLKEPLMKAGGNELNGLKGELSELRRNIFNIERRRKTPSDFGYSTLDEMIERREAVEGKIDKIESSKEYRDAEKAYFAAAKSRRQNRMSNMEFMKKKVAEIREVGIPNGYEMDKHVENPRSRQKKYIEQAYGIYPSDWVKKSFDGTILLETSQRGYHLGSKKSSIIALSGSDDYEKLETAIHEVVHRFEEVVPELSKQEKEFYDARTAGQKEIWMGAGYSKGEKTKPDRFVNVYMGRSNNYEYERFELASMGFQYAYLEPERLAEDPDMQEWILGMLLTL